MYTNNLSNKDLIEGHEFEYSYYNLPEVQKFLDDIPTTYSTKNTDGKGPFTKFWYTIDWRRIELEILRLQHEIFATHNNCRELQEKVVTSPIAKMLAVKKVAMTNQGRKTAGIDNVCKLTHMEAIILSVRLKIDGKAYGLKRIWIPKPNTIEERPLGIPVIKDRAKQALLKMALEPQWEARFNPATYGFRPARSAHDVTWNIRNVLRYGPRYIYDVDLEKCFDKISHNYLIKKLGFTESDVFSKQIRSWLKSKIIDFRYNKVVHPEVGTPQGGVISPLLCNIALHGMYDYIIEDLKKKKVRAKQIEKVKVYTYADDLLIICNNKRVLFYIIESVNEFLKPIGLNIKEKKTRLVYTGNKSVTYTLNLIDHINEDGTYTYKENVKLLPIVYGKKVIFPPINRFNFLGFTFKFFSVGKHMLSKGPKGSTSSLRVAVIPSIEARKRHFSVIRSQLRKCRTPEDVVLRLSPIITGWLNYFAKSDLRAAGGVGLLRTRMNLILLNWQKRVYGHRKRIPTLWIKILGDNWRFFCDIEGGRKLLPTYTDPSYSLTSYKPVRALSSVYDGNIAYWSIRLKSVLGLPTLATKVLAEQRGCCYSCKKPFNIFSEVKSITEKPKSKVSREKVNKRNMIHVVHNNCTI